VDANALDRDVCREHLAEVLAEEAALLGELRTLLEREYEVLGTKDAIAVEKSVLARQERVGALARVEEHRRSLCSLHGYSADYATPKERWFPACASVPSAPPIAAI